MERKKIMVIEDDDDIRNTLAMRLEMEGFDVTTAALGKEGLEKTHRISPDLMILDLKLPDLRGEEVCRQLRDEEYSKLPIIMLTAKDRDTDEVIGCVLGATDYIHKPFDMNKLLERIRSLIK